MSDQAEHTSSETAAAERVEGSGAPGPGSPARESLSWIRALASQWDDDRSSQAATDESPDSTTE